MKRERLRCLFVAALFGVVLSSITGCYYDDHGYGRGRDGYYGRYDRDYYAYRRGYTRDDYAYRRGYDRDDYRWRGRFAHDHDRDYD